MIPKTLILGAILSAVFILAALVSFIWTPFDHAQLNIANKLKDPSLTHWFGTDHFGRDIFSMVMVGARTSIAVAVVAVGIGIALGVPLGLTAAANRGSLLDEVIMRSNDLIFAFPSLVIAILITAVEAGLSYVGLGAQPPTPSWGRMLAESQTMISFAPHIAIFPGLAIVLTVLGLNLMGDGLRDLLDPRLRREMRAGHVFSSR